MAKTITQTATLMKTRADSLYERLVDRYRGDPSVTLPSPKGGTFGASGLKVDGKIFAMLSRGELVVKLPRERVEALVESGKARRFDPGHGRVMKEWATVGTDQSRQWAKLAEEARQFIAGRSG